MHAGRQKYTSKATWLAFGLIALAAIACSAQDSDDQSRASDAAELSQAPQGTGTVSSTVAVAVEGNIEAKRTNAPSQHDLDQAAEASRAYKQAISTLTTLTAHPPLHTFNPALAAPNQGSKTRLYSFLPSVQGQGPIGSALRILLKLHHYTFRRLSTGFAKEGLGIGSKRKDEEQRGKAIKVLDLLQHSAELGNLDALYTLAKISLFPPTQHFAADPRVAFDSFLSHAQQTGNASSQAYIAFFYATGYHGVVTVNQAKAQLYYTFAANGGNKGAQMALGYRYWSGIGTSEDCQRAVLWYEGASEQAMAKFLSGPPGGRTLPQTATRLSDLEGGVYGPGASVASTGHNAGRPAIKAGIARAAGETWEDVLEYYLFSADRGDMDFAYRLGKIFYQGSIYASPGGIASGSEGVGALPQNFPLARHYFMLIVRQVWAREPANLAQYQHVPMKDDHGPVGYAPAAAGYLGRMYLRGEGVKMDIPTAKMWFERGAEYGDRESQNGLGIIYRDALMPGSKADSKTANVNFLAAANHDLAEAQVNIGKYYYHRGELGLAATFFETAVRHGSPFEAYYYLGEIHSAQTSTPGMPGNVVSGSCAMAVSFHKMVAERGSWDEDLMRDAEIAWQSGTDQGKEMAMLRWWIAAERGSEIAQNNMAYILDQDKSILRLTRFSPMVPSNDTARLALTQWTRSAAQRNVDALVKVGDYYYHGLGVSDDSEASRLEKAARYYQSAADTQVSALAMWNLGWMYENGVGVPQDFHLAKRHYDLAAEANPDAYLPVALSLGKLYLRSAWHTLLGGQNGLNLWNSEDEGSDVPKAPETQTLEENLQSDNSKDTLANDDADGEDSPWYIGKAKEEFRRRRNGQTPRTNDDEDPIQWARDRRNAEAERDTDFGPDDYLDGALRGGNREDDVDEFAETMVLVALCLVISVLLYIRTRIVDRMRRDQQQQQQRQQEAGQRAVNGQGVFPPPGDAARDEWAVLR